MLFARFLAENQLLIEPTSGVSISLDECEELAAEEGTDLWGLAAQFAQAMLPQIFRRDDPVLSARIEKINAEGRNAFMEYQLPRAVISLKQGAGRLIRDETDRGVLMICDPRLITKSYGKRIWRSLPPMTRTRDVADVVAFFEAPPVD